MIKHRHGGTPSGGLKSGNSESPGMTLRADVPIPAAATAQSAEYRHITPRLPSGGRSYFSGFGRPTAAAALLIRR